MLRYYLKSRSLSEIQSMENELEEDGFPRRHIHVLSDDDRGVEQRHLNSVPALLRSDGIHWAERGALMGALVGCLVVAVLALNGVVQLMGWPFILLSAALVIGAFTWEAGLIGMQKTNYKFERFQNDLRNGEHLLLIDVDESEVRHLYQHLQQHPELALVAQGHSFVNPFASRETA